MVDGRAVRSCILTTKKAAGKSILTVEGLSPAEQEAFVYAFGAVGGGPVRLLHPRHGHERKGILDAVPDPTRAQVKEALKNNICRCTGYKKIEEAGAAGREAPP